MAQATTRRLFRSQPQKINARVTTIVKRSSENTSRQIAFQDEFLALAGTGGATVVIPTPYNVSQLFNLIEQSNMLRQCIDAMVTNTVLTGWEVDSLVRGRDATKDETIELQSFIDHANSDESLATVLEKTIRDRESVGFGFMEIIRDATQNISILRNAPSMYTRLCALHPDLVPVQYDIARGKRTSSVTEYRRFRRFIQIVNGRMVWFKEFGDPRKMDFENGAFEGEPGYDPSRQATEIYQFKLPSNEPYGVPRWINQLPNIIGSRESEEVNMRYFKDNTVPPMFLLVSGGRLTQQSYRELTRALNSEDLGSDRQNKIMLLEAIGDGDSMEGTKGTIDLKVEKLSDTRQSDGLFKSYDEGNMGKVRSSFRLPPVIVGMSQDVNFATANVSAFIAEAQVFAPERSKIDETMNKLFVNGRSGLQLRTAKLTSRTPAITMPEMVIKTMTALNVMGALTPRRAQAIANKMLQIEIEPYPQKGEAGYEEWMDRPITFAQRGPRGAAYDEGGEDLVTADGPNADPTGNPIDNGGDGPAMTPTGKLPTTQVEQSVKDPATKAIEKTGTLSTNPKNGQQ